MNVGMIGLGAMGRAMALRLTGAGNVVHAFDIDLGAASSLEDADIRICLNPRAVAAACELVISVVWDDDALNEVVFGDEGILAEPGFAGCLVDLSTTSVDIARRIGAAFDARGACFLDGAVIGGGVPVATVGQSPIVVAGSVEAYDRHHAILSTLGKCDHVGNQGAAKIVKLINNHVVGVMSAANAETLSLGLSAGLSIDALFDVLRRGEASSTVLESYIGRYLAEGRYGEGLIGHDLMHKDISLACQLADSVGRSVPFAGLAQQFYVACGQLLGGQAPFPTSLQYFRRLAEAGVDAAPATPAN